MKNKRGTPPGPPQSPAAPPASTAFDNLLSQAFAQLTAGRLAEAEVLCRQILAASPNHAAALHLLGIIAYQVGQNSVALEFIDAALHANPQSAEVCNHRGAILHALSRYSEALAGYDRAIALDPNYLDAHNNRGNTLNSLHRHHEALAACDRAISLRPGSPDAWNNRGNALHALEQHQAAVESYDRAIALNPNFAEAHHNRGCALHAQLAYAPAIESYDEVLRLKPDHVHAHANRGNALLALKQYEPALAGFDRALALDPAYEYLRGTRLFTRRLLCDWQNADDDLAQLEAAIARGERVALPFATLALTASPALQKQAAEIYVADKHPPHPESETEPASIPPRAAHDKIRIGYFSADFYNHATSYLMAELFERHDRTRFEVLGFSFGPDTGDPMRRRVSAAMDRFLDVRSLTDQDIAQLSRSLQVDIAVDLKGFTRNHRAGIFAHRAAPIQVNYLGYPGTMAAPWMDYLIADRTIVPACSRHHYTEKVVYLPGAYQPNDAHRPIAAAAPTRVAEDLPETAFVFCCFNNTYKISPAVFTLWMRIHARVEGSVLWLLEDNAATIANLRSEAARRGISPARLIFARPRPLPEHLARHALADLFLDTTPYNAHTTASDALWTGLPILTLPNETFAGRVAASLLRATSLPESALAGLIAATESEYEQQAVALAHDPERLLSLRTHLRQNRATAPLFDTAAFTRHLEAAYTALLHPERPLNP